MHAKPSKISEYWELERLHELRWFKFSNFGVTLRVCHLFRKTQAFWHAEFVIVRMLVQSACFGTQKVHKLPSWSSIQIFQFSRGKCWCSWSNHAHCLFSLGCCRLKVFLPQLLDNMGIFSPCILLVKNSMAIFFLHSFAKIIDRIN
jgi:hypothetical protein